MDTEKLKTMIKAKYERLRSFPTIYKVIVLLIIVGVALSIYYQRIRQTAQIAEIGGTPQISIPPANITIKTEHVIIQADKVVIEMNGRIYAETTNLPSTATAKSSAHQGKMAFEASWVENNQTVRFNFNFLSADVGDGQTLKNTWHLTSIQSFDPINDSLLWSSSPDLYSPHDFTSPVNHAYLELSARGKKDEYRIKITNFRLFVVNSQIDKPIERSQTTQSFSTQSTANTESTRELPAPSPSTLSVQPSEIPPSSPVNPTSPATASTPTPVATTTTTAMQLATPTPTPTSSTAPSNRTIQSQINNAVVSPIPTPANNTIALVQEEGSPTLTFSSPIPLPSSVPIIQNNITGKIIIALAIASSLAGILILFFVFRSHTPSPPPPLPTQTPLE